MARPYHAESCRMHLETSWEIRILHRGNQLAGAVFVIGIDKGSKGVYGLPFLGMDWICKGRPDN